MTFTPSRARDAWFVVRGYVYQVELTILRWLTLGPSDALELERGEDIDTISAWCAAGGEEVRLLEQVKHLEGAVTLNSAPVRATLANFVEHCAVNTSTDLQLRFLTTAGVGHERDPAMARRMTGLEAWKAVRSGALEGNARLVHLAAIRRLLRRGTKPESVPVDTWTRYRRYLDNARAAEMTTLVLGVEWSTSAPDGAELRSDIRQLLVERGWVRTDSHAEQLYGALFVHVFHALCRPGIKQLTHADRSAVLEHPDVSDRDAAILTLLRERVRQLQSQVANLAEHLELHDSAITGLRDQVVALAAAHGIRGEFAAVGVDAGLSFPRAAERRARRTTAVSAVVALLEAHTWVALHGTSGAGKTELALLVAEAGPSKTWISLRDLHPDAALFRIHGMLAKLAPKVGTNEEWLASAATHLPAAHLVVLDDLPTHDAARARAERYRERLRSPWHSNALHQRPACSRAHALAPWGRPPLGGRPPV